MPMPSWLPLLLGFLIAVGPVSTDMYLPAFPAIEASLHGAPGTAQITLATWFAGLAVGQLTQGTLADRFGRRGPLMAGMALFTVATIGCALAPSLTTLAVFRFVAAFGGSAGMVVPRAVVRDLADGHAAARLLSRLMLVMGAAPVLAPTLGGAILGVASWRTIFWIGVGFGTLCVLLVWRLLPDTLPRDRRVRLGPAALVIRYAGIVRERSFASHATLGGFAMFGMFGYLGGSPDLFIDHFRVSPPVYGMLFGGCAVGLIATAQLNARLLPRLGPGRLLRFATRAMLLATLVLTVDAFTGWGGLLGIYLPLVAMMATNSSKGPNATVGALTRHAAHAGSASALMGTLQFLLGAISGLAVGLLYDGTARPMALLLLLGAAGAALADLARPTANDRLPVPPPIRTTTPPESAMGKRALTAPALPGRDTHPS